MGGANSADIIGAVYSNQEDLTKNIIRNLNTSTISPSGFVVLSQ